MVNIRMLGLAAAIAIFLPAFAVALPTLWPDPNDPSSFLVEGGARQYVSADNVTIFNPPQATRPVAGTELGSEQLVEGHTVFTTLTIEREGVNNTGTLDITAALSCAFETGADTWAPVPAGPSVVPYRVHSTTLQCLENATILIVPDPTRFAGGNMRLQPDGEIIPYVTPTGEVGYEVEYTFEQDGVTRYAWGVSPLAHPFVDQDGALKQAYFALPLSKLREMGAHHFRVIDARELSASP